MALVDSSGVGAFAQSGGNATNNLDYVAERDLSSVGRTEAKPRSTGMFDNFWNYMGKRQEEKTKRTETKTEGKTAQLMSGEKSTVGDIFDAVGDAGTMGGQALASIFGSFFGKEGSTYETGGSGLIDPTGQGEGLADSAPPESSGLMDIITENPVPAVGVAALLGYLGWRALK